MLDLSLFRHPGFVGVSVATFCIGAGMFALFPYLSIYLQSVLGYTPLGAGLRFLPLTVFVFVVPLSMRKLAPGASLRIVLAGGLALVAAALLLMHGLTPSSHWTALLPGLIVSGIGIGLANPAIAAAALRAVDPSRTGMASGINNACRLTGVAVGVAALGAILERRVSTSLADTLGPHGRALAAAVSATGTRVAADRPSLAHPATVAFVSGLNTTLLVSSVVVAIGALAAGLLMRKS
jgi:predicted MFS family arabinose efflux permease